MANARGHFFEHLQEHGNRQLLDRVQRLAVDIFNQQVNLADAKQPVARRLQGIDFDQALVIEQLGDLELVLRLLEKLVMFLALDGHDLERVLLGIVAATHVQNGAVGALAERAENLEFADGLPGHIAGFTRRDRWNRAAAKKHKKHDSTARAWLPGYKGAGITVDKITILSSLVNHL